MTGADASLDSGVEEYSRLMPLTVTWEWTLRRDDKPSAAVQENCVRESKARRSSNNTDCGSIAMSSDSSSIEGDTVSGINPKAKVYGGLRADKQALV